MIVTTLSKAEGPGTAAERVRRALDICLVCLAVLCLAPLLLLVAAAVWLESGGPVLFRQVRIGKGGRYFYMYKFRKFHADAGRAGSPLTLKKDPRLTFVGRILAATKLDELPQLWNVLRGEMSIVGPRPESLAFADCFQNGWEDLLKFKPGLIGPCQIMFRNEAELIPGDVAPDLFYRAVLFPLKARIDLEYFKNRTLAGDFIIMLRGALAVGGYVPAPHAGLVAAKSGPQARAASAGASPASV